MPSPRRARREHRRRASGRRGAGAPPSGARHPKRPRRRAGSRALRSGVVARAAVLACLLEVSAEKVGNVTPTRRFADAGFEDFVASGLVLGPAIATAVPGRVGKAVY